MYTLFVCLLSCVCVPVLLLLFYTFRSKKSGCLLSYNLHLFHLMTSFFSSSAAAWLQTHHTVSLHLPAMDLRPFFQRHLLCFAYPHFPSVLKPVLDLSLSERETLGPSSCGSLLVEMEWKSSPSCRQFQVSGVGLPSPLWLCQQNQSK